MKRVYLILMMIVSVVINVGAIEPIDLSLVRSSVERLFECYPESSLQDVYKSCFQDRFGVVHLLADRETVKTYIIEELEADDYKPDTIYFEPCGWRGDYVRVNLQAIKDGKISVDDLVDAFMASAPAVAPQVTQEWIDEWNVILSVVESVAPRLKNFETDKVAISQLLNRGEYVLHHSRIYSERYSPHYRIIRRDIFEACLEPKLMK